MKKLIFVLVLVSISMLSFAKDNAKVFGFAKSEISTELSSVTQSLAMFTGTAEGWVAYGVYGYLTVYQDNYLNYCAYAETGAEYPRPAGTIDLVEVYLNHNSGYWSNSRSDGGWLVWVEATMSTPGFWTSHYVTYGGVKYGGSGFAI